MKYLKLASCLFIATILFASCDKNKVDIIKDEAIILYEGDPAVDGCGFFLSMDNNQYKPIELKPEFSEDSLTVYVEYQLLVTKWTCNWQAIEYNEIKIIKIKKK